jgi:hypothetical protein
LGNWSADETEGDGSKKILETFLCLEESWWQASELMGQSVLC